MTGASIEWNGDQITAAVKDATAKGLFSAAEHVLEEANRVVPLEEGTLDRSGVASVDEPSLTAAVSFDTPYAARQHEELGWRHAKGRTAKYLETPLVETRDAQGQIIADTIRRATGG